ncbi:MAG: beta-galactosidase [Nanoarchaeota archaeon]|nr:beta-galactosidase [Nanoarchaeota archaeon]
MIHLKYIVFALIAVILLSGCSQKEAQLPSLVAESPPVSAEETTEAPVIEAPTAETQTPEAPAETPKPVSISSSIESNCIGFLTGDAFEAETVKLAGGSMTRPHPGPFVWDFLEPEKGRFNFEETDRWVKEAQRNNIAILATVFPFAEWEQAKCHSEECEVSEIDTFYPRQKEGRGEGLPKSRCKPCNMEDYKTFVAKLVERYDGDGKDDMEGLKIPIKYWEISNEPEMKETQLTFFKGSAEDYADILKQSYATIKKDCPDCKVLHAGAAGGDAFSISFWGKVFDASKDFDIANTHFVKYGDKETLNVKAFRQLLESKGISKPTWVTEAEYENSADVASSFEGALNAGASRVFFTRFEIGKQGPPSHGVFDKAYEGLECKKPPSI